MREGRGTRGVSGRDQGRYEEGLKEKLEHKENQRNLRLHS
jgi:hypothetical protein